jgi:segregation and condensation protein B
VNAEPDRLAILEGLLFVAEEPLPLSKLREILADEETDATEMSLRDLAVRLEERGGGLMVQEVAGGYRLATRPEVHPWIQKLQQVKPARLSRAALETLAIIAYRQPITRAEIESIRGVAVDGVLRTLLERELVRMMGRKAEAGRPMLYGTSHLFLEHFGLRELGDLPTLREINELIGITEGGADVDAPVETSGGVPEPTPDAADAGQTVDGPDGSAPEPVAAIDEAEAGSPGSSAVADHSTHAAAGDESPPAADPPTESTDSRA